MGASVIDARAALLQAWLIEQATIIEQNEATEPNASAETAVFTPVSGDASFRRYFRLRWGNRSVIGVDAPPEKENCEPFVRIGAAMLAHGVRVPQVLARDVAGGFMMLDDFGDVLLRPQLNAATVATFYGQAMQDLLHIQECEFSPELPAYDEPLLLREMALFPDWFLKVHLQLSLSAAEEQLLADAFTCLKDAALEQPRVTVHRDYHSRNIMVLPAGGLGHIDFQDAVHGPVTYDLVSLLRDCYVDWPVEQVYGWALAFAELLRQAGRLAADDATFRRWFDAMGAQRHLKAIGIFARLFHRDGKAGYLPDIPRTFGYLLHETAVTPELQAFHDWLQARVVPALCEKDPEAARYLGGASA